MRGTPRAHCAPALSHRRLPACPISAPPRLASAVVRPCLLPPASGIPHPASGILSAGPLPRPCALQLCTTVCADHDESCKGWAKEGQCEENKAFMYRVCPASCGICQLLESPDKDEL